MISNKEIIFLYNISSIFCLRHPWLRHLVFIKASQQHITWRKRCATPAAPLGLRSHLKQIMLAFFTLMQYKTSASLSCGTCRFAARRLRQAR